MRVLVLGATEFTGPFVVRDLVEGGHAVAVFHRGDHEHPLTGDVAHAICLAIRDERAAGRTYNVCEPVAYSEEEWIWRIAAGHGWEGEISLIEKEQELDLQQDYVVDSSRIRAELGYAERVDPDEAFRRTIEWERSGFSPDRTPQAQPRRDRATLRGCSRPRVQLRRAARVRPHVSRAP